MATISVTSDSLPALQGFIAGVHFVNDSAVSLVGEVDTQERTALFQDRDSDEDREIHLDADGLMV